MAQKAGKWRIVLPERLLFDLMETVNRQNPPKKNQNILVHIGDLLASFKESPLKSINSSLALKTIGVSGDSIERAFGKRNPHGCSLEFANLICCFITGENVSLKEYCIRNDIPEDSIAKLSRPSGRTTSVFEASTQIGRSAIHVIEEDTLKSLFAKRYTDDAFQLHENIISNSDTSLLNINDFYVDVSYINRSEFKTQNDFYLIEKEGYNLSGRSYRNSFFANQFSVEIATEKIILSNNYTILMGNPGVGKSTYAKWVCLKWAKGHISLNAIPVYIVARELDLRQPNCILAYINLHYKSLSRNPILKDDVAKFKLLIDGFDEATSEQRAAIEAALRMLSDKGNYPNFVIFSRPYALVNSNLIKIATLFEITGFSDLNIERYINRYFQKKNQKKGAAGFKSFLKENSLLKDLSHNPLNLANMLSIFDSDNGKILLSQVRSTYDLYWIAMEFVIAYHTSIKGMDIEQYWQKLELCLPFALYLEVSLTFIYFPKGLGDSYMNCAKVLSELGLGRVEKHNGIGGNVFYFLNVRYQEMLAAKQFCKTFCIETFLVLMDNPLYWYFGRLIIGHLIASNKTEHILNLLKVVKGKVIKVKTYEMCLYYVILGELPRGILNQVLLPDDIKAILSTAGTVVSDLVIGKIYIDSIQLIYNKLEEKQKNIFEEELAKMMRESVTIPAGKVKRQLSLKERSALIMPTYLGEVVEKLNLFSSEVIINAIVEVAIQLLNFNLNHEEWTDILHEAGKFGKEHYDVSILIQNELYKWLILLYQITEENKIEPHDKVLWNALQMGGVHSSIIIRIISTYTPVDVFIKKFDTLYKKRENTDHDFWLTLYVVAMTQMNYYEIVPDKIKKRIFQLQALLQKVDVEDELANYIFDNFSLALSRTGDAELIEPLSWANGIQVNAPNVMENIPVGVTLSVFDSFFDKTRTRPISPDDFFELCGLVESCDSGYLAIQERFEQFKNLFSRYIRENIYTLSKLAGLPSQGGIIHNRHSEALYLTCNILYYPSTIKNFLDELFASDLMDNDFVSEHFVCYLMACGVPLIEDKYWDKLKSLLSVGSVDLVLSVLCENDTIFKYSSNLVHLEEIWSILSSNREVSKALRKHKPELLQLSYSSAKLHFETKEEFSNLRLIQSIGQVLTTHKIYGSRLCTADLLIEGRIEWFCAFPILYSYLSDSIFLIDEEMAAQFGQLDRDTLTLFLNELADISTYKINQFQYGIHSSLYDIYKEYLNFIMRRDLTEIKNLILN